MLDVLNTIQLHLPQTFSVFAGICVNKAFFACEKSCLPIQANHLVNMQRGSMLIFSWTLRIMCKGIETIWFQREPEFLSLLD